MKPIYILVKNKKEMNKLIDADILKTSYGFKCKLNESIPVNKYPTIFIIDKENNYISHQSNSKKIWCKPRYLNWIINCISVDEAIKQKQQKDEYMTIDELEQNLTNGNFSDVAENIIRRGDSITSIYDELSDAEFTNDKLSRDIMIVADIIIDIERNERLLENTK